MEIVLVVLVLLLVGAAFVGWKSLHRIPDNRVGIVTRKIGLDRRPDDDPRISHRNARGVQAAVLGPNTTAWLLPVLHSVRIVPMVTVPSGSIGLVDALAGRPLELGTPIAAYVECDYFQDGVAFLRNGGVRGRQQQPLTSGTYAINTEMFGVLTVNSPEAVLTREELTADSLREIRIDVGETGVVVTHFGARPVPGEVGPPVDGHFDFQRPWEFLANGGRIGVQRDTLSQAGRYSINPWFAKVVKVPTRVLQLEWNAQDKSKSNLDANLDQVQLDIQGHKVWLDMKQTVEIPAESAPQLVLRYGADGQDGRESVQRFVEKDLATTVTNNFRRISARYRIQEFITRYDEVCNELANEVEQALAPLGVRALTTTLEDFRCDDEEIMVIRRKIAYQEEQVKLERAKLAELQASLANEKVRTEIGLQRVKVQEEMRRLDEIKLTMLVEMLGAQNVAMERMLSEWVKANVPQFIGNGGSVHALLQAMPTTQAKDLLLAIATGGQQQLLGSPDVPELTAAEPDATDGEDRP